MTAQRTGQTSSRISPGPRLALEDRLARSEGAGCVAPCPGVGQHVGRLVGAVATSISISRSPTGSPAAQVATLSTSDASDLRVVSDKLDEQRASFGLGTDPSQPELLRDPALDAPSWRPRTRGSAPPSRRPSRAPSSSCILAHERKHVSGAGLRRYALTASTSAAFQPPFRRPSESRAPSTSSTTTSASWNRRGLPRCRAHCLVTRRCRARSTRRSTPPRSAAQARERRLDLRAVAAREQIDGLVGSVGHAALAQRFSRRADSRVDGRRTRRRRGRPNPFGRPRAPATRPGRRASRAADGRSRCSSRTR